MNELEEDYKNRNHLKYDDAIQDDIYADELHDAVVHDETKPSNFENILMQKTLINIDVDTDIGFQEYFSDRCQVVSLNQIMTPHTFNQIYIKDSKYNI